MSNDRKSSVGAPKTRRKSFAQWRRERPFWGSLLAIVAGIEIEWVALAFSKLSVVVMTGLPGLLTIVIALLAVIMGAVTMFQPPQRVITGWIVVALGPISILATNLGGFVVGMIMLVVGGSLMLSWQPAEAGAGGTATGRATAEPAAIDEAPAYAPAAYNPVEEAARSYESTAVYDNPVPGFGPAAAPVVAAPTAPAGPGEPAADGVETRTRNPWRSTRSAAPADPAPASAPETVDSYSSGTYSSGTYSSGSYSSDEAPAAETDGTTGRSWFGKDAEDGSTGTASADASALRPLGVEPPSLQARSTLLIPVIAMVMLATALGAGPAAASTGQPAGLFDWLLNPTASATTTAPAATPSATPTPGLTLPTVALPTIPGLGGGTSPTPSTSPTTAAPPGGTCPTADLPAGTTSGGAAAIAGAAAIQACMAADQTATVSKAATVPNISGVISTLYAPRLEMSGFKYNGVKTIDTNNGPVELLTFSADKLVIDGFDHRIPFTGGETRLNNTGSQLVATGNVQLYVTSMQGKIYGIDLLNLTFTPDFAPPLVLPSMFFTDTTSKVAYFSADKITLPTLKITVDES